MLFFFINVFANKKSYNNSEIKLPNNIEDKSYGLSLRGNGGNVSITHGSNANKAEVIVYISRDIAMKPERGRVDEVYSFKKNTSNDPQIDET